MIKRELQRFFKSEKTKGPFSVCGRFRRVEAAELLEFALALPLILVMVVGLLDFASAYHLKQELANAAREGARLASSEPTSDRTQTNPASVQAVKDDVTSYLQDAGVNTSFISSTMTPAGNFTWTYYSSGTYGLKIERNYQITDTTTGGLITANRVTLTYPYNWMYGFNNVIKLLIPSSNIAGSITIETDAAMPQL